MQAKPLGGVSTIDGDLDETARTRQGHRHSLWDGLIKPSQLADALAFEEHGHLGFAQLRECCRWNVGDGVAESVNEHHLAVNPAAVAHGFRPRHPHELLQSCPKLPATPPAPQSPANRP